MRAVRKDFQKSKKTIQRGKICSYSSDDVVCGKFVLDLRIHLRHFHKLLPSDEVFLTILNTSQIFERPVIQKGAVTSSLTHSNPNQQSLPPSLNPTHDSEIFDFQTNSDNDSSTPIENHSLHLSGKFLLPKNLSRAMEIFETFQSSIWEEQMTYALLKQIVRIFC